MVNLYPVILVVNLYISLVYCYTLLLNFTYYFCCQPLSYDAGGQPLHCTCSLLHYAVYWCTVHAGSIMLSELKMSGKRQRFCLLLIYLKHSTEQKSHFIKL